MTCGARSSVLTGTGTRALQVELLPGPASVTACSYAIQGAAKHAPATVLAGQQLVRLIEAAELMLVRLGMPASTCEPHLRDSQTSSITDCVWPRSAEA